MHEVMDHIISAYGPAIWLSTDLTAYGYWAIKNGMDFLLLCNGVALCVHLFWDFKLLIFWERDIVESGKTHTITLVCIKPRQTHIAKIIWGKDFNINIGCMHH